MTNNEIPESVQLILDNLRVVHTELGYDVHALEHSGQHSMAGAIKYRRHMLKEEIDRLAKVYLHIALPG